MFDSLFSTNGSSTEQDGAIGFADAAARLLAADGPLARYPEPAALVRPTGRVIAANGPAAALHGMFGRGGRLSQAVGEAVESGRPVRTVLSVPGGADASATYEFTVLSLGEGGALVLGRDISMDVSLKEAMADSRRRYKELVELSSDFAWETDPDGAFVFVSSSGALGYGVDDLVSRPAAAILDHAFEPGGALPFTARAPVNDVDVWCRRRDGSSACLQASAVPVHDRQGRWTGARGICRDVTRTRERDAAIALAETRKQLLAHIVRSIRNEIDPAAMLAAAASDTAHALGGPFCRIYRYDEREGFTAAAEFGEPPIGPDLERSMLGRLCAQHETVVGIEFECCVVCVPALFRRTMNGAVLVARPRPHGQWDEEERALGADIAGQLAIAFEQMQNQARLEALSRTDELTGLLNRRAFYEELRDRVARRAVGTLFFIDVDNFKSVNDVHGHQRGDEALVAVAELLRTFSRPGDLVARLGGDEFALWMERMDAATASSRAGALAGAAETLKRFNGRPDRPLGLSIGIAVNDPSRRCKTVAELTGRADSAMYRVKKAGKGGAAVDMDEAPAAEAAP